MFFPESNVRVVSDSEIIHYERTNNVCIKIHYVIRLIGKTRRVQSKELILAHGFVFKDHN